MKAFFGCYMVILLTLMIACTSKAKVYNRQELINYINNPNNGLTQKREVGKINATLTFHPIELMTSDRNNKTIKDNEIKSFKDKYYFVLSFSSQNKELLKQLPFNQYSDMVQVLSFRMKDYISIITDNGKTVDPIDCIFLQTYGMSNANQLMLVFDKKKLNDTNQLKLILKEFGLNIGDVTFNLRINDIKNTPIIN